MATYYVDCGIHSRLQFIINHSGGLDKEARLLYLAKTYDLAKDDAKLLYRYPVEELLEKYSLDELMKHAKKNIKDNEIALMQFLSVTSALHELSTWR